MGLRPSLLVRSAEHSFEDSREGHVPVSQASPAAGKALS